MDANELLRLKKISGLASLFSDKNFSKSWGYPMPNRNQNLAGKHFGHLTVIVKSDERGTQNEYKWLCRCDCGRLTTVSTGQLNSGQTTSCGHIKARNLESGGQHHQSLLGDKPPVSNKTGYRNISMTKRNGRWRYRVSVQYNRKQHSTLVDTLEEALAARERLREKWWPGYKNKDKL